MVMKLFFVLCLLNVAQEVVGFAAPNRGSVALKVATMADIPQVFAPNKDVDRDKDGIPKLGAIMKMLPKESFEIDTKTSLAYFAIDAAAVIASLGFLDAVVTSDIYHSLPVWQQAMMVAPLQVLAGFAMWCMWCIGHEAGHSLISKKDWINQVVGEIAHSVICLTPFVPWQLSHQRHHVNHNHVEKDYSHQWFIREQSEDMEWWMKAGFATRNVQIPFLYLVYLFVGIPDGGHVFFYGKLWEDQALKTKIRGALSVAVSMATAGSLWMNMGTADFAVVCFAPWLVCSFWLFMVTYLQHHSDDGKLYTDDTFTFTKGAFETVDRTYGKWVDRMSHHMMDGHVVHHLFFEKVPHYRLEEATKALTKGLAEQDQLDLYKRIETKDFTQEIVKQFDANWFFINEAQVVRK
jgi:omega-3 fatty acid desaturase (delta-15 desaturase)